MTEMNVPALAQIEDRVKQLVTRAENAAIRAEVAAGLRPAEPEEPKDSPYKRVAPNL